MNKRFLFFFLCGFYCYSCFAQTEALKRPKLVVGLVVDQMRWDYLYRFYDRYGEGGFKRILRTGFSHENTYIDHLPTVTAIGHTAVYTGSVPSIHGITGNDFIIEHTGQGMYCTEDATVQGLGVEGRKGHMSPRNLLVSTITDELKLATNFRSKVIGIAIKDRGSILPAGHFADAAYWFGPNASWVSSTYYLKALPQWVQQFNGRQHARKYLEKGWNTLYPIESYKQSSPDNNRYEGHLEGTASPTLPIPAETLLKNGLEVIRDTPFGNSYTLDFAKEAVKKERLGNNPEHVPDFLAVSLSSTDGIGHKFGVNALEVEDMYLRLDQDLAEFFDFLDGEVGKGEYTFFLTADHGASHNNPFFIDHKGAGGYMPQEASADYLNQALKQQFGYDSLVISTANYQIHLNHATIAAKELNEAAIRSFLVNALRRVEGVAYAVDMDSLSTATIAQPIRERLINSYHYERSGVITIIPYPQWKGGNSSQTGTGHGTWNPYDAHIPLLWMGWGIKQGASNRVTFMTDIAPTLAALLHIQEPNGNVGRPLTDLLNLP